MRNMYLDKKPDQIFKGRQVFQYNIKLQYFNQTLKVILWKRKITKLLFFPSWY